MEPVNSHCLAPLRYIRCDRIQFRLQITRLFLVRHYGIVVVESKIGSRKPAFNYNKVFLPLKLQTTLLIGIQNKAFQIAKQTKVSNRTNEIEVKR